MIYTSYTFNTHHLWLISRIRARFRHNIQESTILAIYDDIMWFTDIDARYPWVYHFAFDDDIQELVTLLTMTGIWTFYWFCWYRAFPHSSSVLHDMMISITFLQLTMWRYSALFDYSAFNDIAQLMLLWRYPVIQHFYVFNDILHF
jgi:hypothetical protein